MARANRPAFSETATLLIAPTPTRGLIEISFLVYGRFAILNTSTVLVMLFVTKILLLVGS
jgi:hypothetical protein